MRNSCRRGVPSRHERRPHGHKWALEVVQEEVTRRPPDECLRYRAVQIFDLWNGHFHLSAPGHRLTSTSWYLAKERPGAAASEPLFLVRYWWYGGERKTRRMSGQRVWKIIKDLGKRVGVDTIHPHAFRHACGVELLKRSGGNLRAVQEHLSHADIQTTTIYTPLAPQDLQKVVNLFDQNGGAAR